MAKYMEEAIVEDHESFGTIAFCRVTGGSTNLFGSSIKHQNVIRLRLSHAQKVRDLHRDWYRSRGEIIEVEMSQSQFAEAITSMNMGDGVPCTIVHIQGRRAEKCPEVHQRQVFEREFEEDIHKVMKQATDAANAATELLSKDRITKKDCREIIKTLSMMVQNIKSNMPFVHQQFNEAMDKSVCEAKGEVEAFTLNRLASAGMVAIAEQERDAAAKVFEIEAEQATP